MIHFGSAWYPEHWPEARWQRDLELMVGAGFSVVRIGEFAWSSMEPADGTFTLDWLVRACDLAHEFGLQAVMGTPTAAPPAWLTRAHPDILPVRDATTGATQLHGQRGHYDPTNATYRRYCQRITAQLADAVADHPAVIGWQTDNEFWTIASNQSALADFRAWCLERYGSLEALNEAWSSAYWSQTYSHPDELQPPMEYPNPGLFLAWRRWASAATTAFQQIQIDTLRARIPAEQWICHNFHPYDDQDRAVIADPLDLVSWDAYILRQDQDRLDPAYSGRDADRIRDLNNRERPFWIMETLPGFVNWREVNRHFDPGESRTMAWHLIGHGADAVLYWQWRSAPGGQEQYHGCLLQQDGEPRPVYHEAVAIGAEFKQVGALLGGSTPVAEVAIVDRWCDRTALGRQPHHRDYDPALVPVTWYRATQSLGLGQRVLETVDQAPAQKLLIAPQLHLLDDAAEAAIAAHLAAGGHLLIGPRFAMKNDENALRQQRQPGPFAADAGAIVDEYYSLPDSLSINGALCGHIEHFAEWWRITDDNVEVLARFDDQHPWLAGQPAVFSTATTAGGRITVCAGCPDDDLALAVTSWACQQAGLTAPIVPEYGVEICRRRQGDQELAIVINHQHKPAVQTLPGSWHDHLADTDHDDEITMPGYGVAVISRREPSS